jgi:hypothetical protein
MHHRKKRRVSGSGTNTVLIIGGIAVVGVIAYMMLNKSQPATTIIKTPTPTNSSTATTAAEIAAGAGLATTLANDLLGDDNS